MRPAARAVTHSNAGKCVLFTGAPEACMLLPDRHANPSPRFRAPDRSPCRFLGHGCRRGRALLIERAGDRSRSARLPPRDWQQACRLEFEGRAARERRAKAALQAQQKGRIGPRKEQQEDLFQPRSHRCRKCAVGQEHSPSQGGTARTCPAQEGDAHAANASAVTHGSSTSVAAEAKEVTRVREALSRS